MEGGSRIKAMLAGLFGEAQAVTEARAKEVLPPWHPTSQGHPFSCINTHEPAQLTGLLLPQKDTFQLPELGISTGGTAVPCLRSAQLSSRRSHAPAELLPTPEPSKHLSRVHNHNSAKLSVTLLQQYLPYKTAEV